MSDLRLIINVIMIFQDEERTLFLIRVLKYHML